MEQLDQDLQELLEFTDYSTASEERLQSLVKKIQGKLEKSLTEQQRKWLYRVGGIARGDYQNARHVTSWIDDILKGKDMTQEFADYD